MFQLIAAALTLHSQMKYFLNILLLTVFIFLLNTNLLAQCSVCTKTALQLGEGPAKGMNTAILYLMMSPFAIVGFIGYRWWKGNKKFEEEE
jgi:hypothetical protein